MSINNIPATLFLLLLGVAYAVLFYQAEMGINLLLFDALLIVAALTCRPELAKQKPFAWSVAGMLFAAGCVIIVHGEAALWAHHLTYLIVLGFVQARELRFIWYGLLLGLITIFRGPVQWLRAIATNWTKQSGTPSGTSWLRQARNIIPALLILVPFLVFYLSGNQRLAGSLLSLFGWVGDLSINFSVVWSVSLFFFGMWLTVGILFPRILPARLTQHQAGFDDYLHRRRERRIPTSVSYRFSDIAGQPYRYEKTGKKILGLRHEYRQAIITFGLLNVVLALVNVTDLLYFFRGNLNFFSGDTVLRPLVRVWLAQNALLALSVGLRNYHYIDAYGLALGRVYVGFVLLLMLFGLFPNQRHCHLAVAAGLCCRQLAGRNYPLQYFRPDHRRGRLGLPPPRSRPAEHFSPPAPRGSGPGNAPTDIPRFS